MMTVLFTGMVVLSVLFGLLTGRMDAVSTAAITSCGKGVELVLSLLGAMCLWSGVMEVARKAGLTELLSRLFSPVTRRLFRGIRPKGKAMEAITMNLAANLLGLGNAATPLGITAMQEMAKEEWSGKVATNNMILFVVLNTASLQVIPTNLILLRTQAGSQNPAELIPAVWLASLASILVGVTAAKLLERMGRR